jgi:hypothetical protein
MTNPKLSSHEEKLPKIGEKEYNASVAGENSDSLSLQVTDKNY